MVANPTPSHKNKDMAMVGHPDWQDRRLLRHLQHNPSGFQIEVVDGAVVDERIGHSVVIHQCGAMQQADLSGANLLG
jgi:hypothetical protein